MDVLPDHIKFKILGYLPLEILLNLKLPMKFYWLIYREIKPKLRWNASVDWKHKILPPHSFQVTDRLYVHTLSDLIDGKSCEFKTDRNKIFTVQTFQNRGYFIKTIDKNLNWKNWYAIYHGVKNEFLSGNYYNGKIIKPCKYQVQVDGLIKIILEAKKSHPWVKKVVSKINNADVLLDEFNRFPMLFISNRKLTLTEIVLTHRSETRYLLIWDLYCRGERSGIVVLQPKFYNMYGDVPGLAEYKNLRGFTSAIGQFNCKLFLNCFPKYLDYKTAQPPVVSDNESDNEEGKNLLALSEKSDISDSPESDSWSTNESDWWYTSDDSDEFFF
ncbi:hypothetical protein LCDVSa101R [Lymphocystis disease virus 3]|uniref:F-box domain-containing protein n=1 Tax=Lymphocystis disease virus 3 TaxID=2560566 RepID=A0A1B2RW18_9VIRU|nr:hypothetical protein BZK12_gp101 [Lymphocystis disease virus Sa]AOC55185.1 hypothetical protein LCDVSa101R [Lymphocystis disease virus 3]